MRAIVDTTGATILRTSAPEPHRRPRPADRRPRDRPADLRHQVVVVGADRRSEILRIVTVDSPDDSVISARS
ncbi:hypothetical protein [Mycobacterium sp.]|uniref:hypothetical protein n=1 Tax=Mycobacterium sp. TaxID=1785 RepID=UPI00261F02F5|nr:hypothetical protein [Mycobacterium sp.]